MRKENQKLLFVITKRGVDVGDQMARLYSVKAGTSVSSYYFLQHLGFVLYQCFRFVQNANERENFTMRLHLQIGCWTSTGVHEQ